MFHICNLKATDWNKLVSSVAKACNASVVPFGKWVAALESYQEDGVQDPDLSSLPALALLEFFRMIAADQYRSPPSLETTNSQYSSDTILQLKPVDNELMGVWLAQLESWIPELKI